MKLLFTLLIVTGLTYSQTFEWARVTPVNLTTNPTYLSNQIVSDTSANLIGTRLLVNKGILSQSYIGDYVIEKLDTDGDLIWQDTAIGKVSLQWLCNDRDNNIITAGVFKDTLKLQGLMLIDLSGDPIGFIIKLNSYGEILWHKALTASLPDLSRIQGMTIDNQNNIWITAVNNFQDSFIKKFNVSGDEVQSLVQTNVLSISGIDVDNSGNIFVAGATSNDNQSFNGFNIIPPHDYNMYVVKYNSSGIAAWVRFVEDITFQEFAITCDAYGNTYFSGRLFNATTFGNISVDGPNWVYDFFLAKINPAGEFVWVREAPNGAITGDAGPGNANFLVSDNFGNVYFAGFQRGSLDWGNGIVTNATNISEDVLQLKYSSNGVLLWAKTAGSISYDRAESVTLDKYGKCILTGRVSANSVFDSLQFNGGSINSFIAKLNQPVIVPVELVSFTGAFSAEGVILSWTTATEINNRGFEIERMQVFNLQSSVSSQEWELQGFVDGEGTTSDQQSYSFTDKDIANGKYSYRLKQIDFDGTFEYSEAVEVSFMKPSIFYLEQNYPNPFNPSTTIRFTVRDAYYASPAWVTLRVYDVLGNEVATLVNEEKLPGYYEINYNAPNLSSGVYYYRLSAGNYVETKKMLMVK